MIEDQSSHALESVNLLDELAQRRREVTEDQTLKPHPDFLESIDQSEVQYVFRPNDIPLPQVDASLFLAMMKENYGARLGELDISQLFGTVPRERILALDESDALQQILESGSRRKFHFLGGKFPLKFDFVTIRNISIDFESIIVSVSGVSQVAETVAQETIQLLWSAAGSQKSWDKLAPTRQMVRYGTSTRVRLPFAAEQLIAQDMRSFFDEQFFSGERFIESVCGLSYRNNFGPRTGLQGVVTLDDLCLKVSTFDPLTGAAEEQMLKFSVTSRGDHGVGAIRIVSTMQYDQHIKYVRMLIERIVKTAES